MTDNTPLEYQILLTTLRRWYPAITMLPINPRKPREVHFSLIRGLASMVLDVDDEAGVRYITLTYQEKETTHEVTGTFREGLAGEMKALIDQVLYPRWEALKPEIDRFSRVATEAAALTDFLGHGNLQFRHDRYAYPTHGWELDDFLSAEWLDYYRAPIHGETCFLTREDGSGIYVRLFTVLQRPGKMVFGMEDLSTTPPTPITSLPGKNTLVPANAGINAVVKHFQGSKSKTEA